MATQSNLGRTAKYHYSEEKQRNLLLLPHREQDEWLTFWIDFFATFIALYYIHFKLKESTDEKEFGEKQRNFIRRKRNLWWNIKAREIKYWKYRRIKMNTIYTQLEGNFDNDVCRNIFRKLVKTRKGEVLKSKKRIEGSVVDYQKMF
jgi:hypothetical protein